MSWGHPACSPRLFPWSQAKGDIPISGEHLQLSQSPPEAAVARRSVLDKLKPVSGPVLVGGRGRLFSQSCL